MSLGLVFKENYEFYLKKKKTGGIEYKCENRWIFLDGDEQLKWK